MPSTETAYDPQAVAQTLRERRTVSPGSLRTERPEHRKVLAALESARWAPNHRLTEPWTFYVLDRERTGRLGELWADLLVRNGAKLEKVERKRSEWGQAPGVMILTCTSAPGADATTRKDDYAACCCAAQNFMLHLWSEGLGSKWSTGAVWEHESFWNLLGHTAPPFDTEVVGVFFYGVPERVPAGRRTKALGDVVVDFATGSL